MSCPFAPSLDIKKKHDDLTDLVWGQFSLVGMTGGQLEAARVGQAMTTTAVAPSPSKGTSLSLNQSNYLNNTIKL